MRIERTSVVDQILDYIKTNISSGVWNPGEKIESELNLVEQLNVSRASVHNAIQQLIALGVLESYQGKGTYVKSIPVSEIEARLGAITQSSTMRKLIEFRIILESEVCRQIAGHISENTINELYECVEGMRQNKSELKKFVKHDIRFHRILVQATRNEIICRSIDIICDEMQRQSLMLATSESEEDAIQYHKLIADHLKKRDGEGAAQAMTRHLQATPCHPPFTVQPQNANLFNLSEGI